MEKNFLKAKLGGGAKVPHRKYTMESETVSMPAPERVVIPLTQHIGAPAALAVAKGDHVYVGTPVGTASGFVSADTHASVSGTVADITEILFSDGSMRQAVVIENDGRMEADPAIAPPVVNSRDDLVKAVQRSGLIGLGGAGFPTHVKLAPTDKYLDLLLINGAECEPYITSDYRTMMEEADDVIEGAAALLRWLELPRAVIAVEKNKPKAIALLREKAERDSRIEVLELKSSYPQGAEKVLIGNVTGRAVPSGGLPADASVVILNVTTVVFLSRFLKTGMPLTAKRITVDGKAVEKSGNYLCPIGMPISDIAAGCRVDMDSTERILLGGPMMGTALYSADFPLLKNHNAVLALTSAETGDVPNHNCIRCGRCAYNCPMRLSPVEISLAYKFRDIERQKKLSVMNCIECGCCSYNCPAGKPLTQTMRLSKSAVRAEQMKEKAEAAKKAAEKEEANG